jgi:hypothetical protein
VRNLPTTRYDEDGHCPDGICIDITKLTPAQVDHLAYVNKHEFIGAGKTLVNAVTSTVNILLNAATHNGTYVPGAASPEIPQLKPANPAQAAGMFTMDVGLVGTGLISGGAAIVDLTSTVRAAGHRVGFGREHSI